MEPMLAAEGSGQNSRGLGHCSRTSPASRAGLGRGAVQAGPEAVGQ